MSGTGASVDMLASAAEPRVGGVRRGDLPRLYAMIANDYMHRYPLHPASSLQSCGEEPRERFEEPDRAVQEPHHG